MGELIAEYIYDAHGNHNVSAVTGYEDLAERNAFRYRGYYYDVKMGFYSVGLRYYDPEVGRWINSDDVEVATTLGMGILGGMNLYAYCLNDPVNHTDSTGCFIDYILDAVFLVWSIVDVVRNPSDWKNWAALGVDLVFAVIPFVPSGAGQAIKMGNKIDNAFDVASAINKIDNIHDIGKVTMIGRDMNRVKDTANLIGKADNLYDIWKGYDRVASVSKPIANVMSAAHNGGWLFGKLRKGYSVIDIGITTLHKGRGLWYGTERAVLALWRTRNIWKLSLNYYL